MVELLATASGAEVKVWRPDAQHAECVAAAAMRCDVHALTWSPTNGALACGGSDGRAHLLKPTGELLGRIPGDADAEAEYPDASGPPAIYDLAFSKGSRYLATGGASDEVALWDLKRKAKLKSLAGRAGDARAVAYSPGDQHVASAGSAGVVVLHSPVSGLIVGEMAPPTSFDGVRGGAENAPPPGVTSLHYSPHRRQSLATSCEDGCVRLWDAGVRRLAGTIDACAKTNVPCAFARFSPADANVLAAASSRGVCFLDAAVSRAAFASVDVGAPATSLAWRSDGGALAVGASDGRVIWLDPRMLGGPRSSGDEAHPSVLYTTAARVGGGGGVDAVRWQTAPEGGARRGIARGGGGGGGHAVAHAIEIELRRRGPRAFVRGRRIRANAGERRRRRRRDKRRRRVAEAVSVARGGGVGGPRLSRRFFRRHGARRRRAADADDGEDADERGGVGVGGSGAFVVSDRGGDASPRGALDVRAGVGRDARSVGGGDAPDEG